MPPKNKKDADEQAKKLQQQRKRKQEQEAKLQIQRKKYLSETLSSGLFLPASNQLIIDFSHKSLDLISEKLKEAIKDSFPEIIKSNRLQFVLKQLHYFIKDSLKIFGQTKQGMNLPKHRIFIGIMFSILLNNDHQGNGQHKNRIQDQRKARQLVTIHCNKIEGFEHLTKNEGLSILKYAKQTYFSKFLLLKFFDKFSKRQSESKFRIYIETPNVYINDQNTPFTDLRNKDGQNK